MDDFGLVEEDIKNIQAVFSKRKEIEKVVIYGSRAKGNYKPFSDIDLTLMGDKIDLNLQLSIELELDDLMLPYKFDISIYDKTTNPEFLNHIHRIGKEFYKKTL